MILITIERAWEISVPKIQFSCSQPSVLSLLHIFPGYLLIFPAYWEPSISGMLIVLVLQSQIFVHLFVMSIHLSWLEFDVGVWVQLEYLTHSCLQNKFYLTVSPWTLLLVEIYCSDRLIFFTEKAFSISWINDSFVALSPVSHCKWWDGSHWKVPGDSQDLISHLCQIVNMVVEVDQGCPSSTPPLLSSHSKPTFCLSGIVTVASLTSLPIT